MITPMLLLFPIATFVALSGAQSDPGLDCQLLGPAYPAPSKLSNSSLFASAVDEFEAHLLNNTEAFLENDVGWTLSIFSAKEDKVIYERYHTPEVDMGVEKIDRDSIFRLASVSKLFTVWTILTAIGDSRFNDPITKYIPELADGKFTTNDVYDDIEQVNWEDITVGELASQSAGIARDVTLSDLSASSFSEEQLQAIGFPALNQSDLPPCGANSTQRPCTREEVFDLLFQKTPVWPSSHSPAYSNIAFTLLEYALEAITGKNLEDSMQELIFEPLGMNHSSYKDIPSTGGVIPSGDPDTAGWTWELGVDNPGGSVYMSSGDLVKAGQGILKSTLLQPALTRRWLQPKIMTGYQGAAVGAPWEITYLKSSNNRRVQYFMKDGDLLAYHGSIVLSPDHEIGFAILTAGALTAMPGPGTLRTLLKVAVGDILMPAIEEQAKAEAAANFDGTYIDEATNSSVTIEAGYNDHMGLTVQSLISRGVPLIGPGTSPDGFMAGALGVGNTTRLFPTTLKTTRNRSDGNGTYEARLGFRAAFSQALPFEGTIQDVCLQNWAGLDGINYGRQALDDWVFGLSEDGRATSVTNRLLRLKLVRDLD